MISKKTAMHIFNTYREIEVAKKLIADMKEALANEENTESEIKLKDAFGESKGLQLGVPSGPSSQRLFSVSPVLSVEIIKDHIKRGNERLEELKAICQIELGVS